MVSVSGKSHCLCNPIPHIIWCAQNEDTALSKHSLDNKKVSGSTLKQCLQFYFNHTDAWQAFTKY